MKNRDGFIPILVIAIVTMFITSGALTGVVLHKQGKLIPLVANVSEVFRRAESKPEEVKKSPREGVAPQPVNKEAQKRIEELEQKIEKLEDKKQAPPLSAPTPNQKPTTASTLPTSPPQTQISTPQSIPALQEDSTLKVARCQAEARQKVDQLVNQALASYLPIFQKQLDEAHAKWVETRQEQIRRSMETPSELIGADPYTQRQARDAAALAIQPTVDYYANLENQIADQWEQAKGEARRVGELQYNSLYLECLNK